MGRAPCCDKASVKKGPWSPDEDAKLKDYIHTHGAGGNWIALPHKAGLQRCGKSCRLRWLNYLRPNIKHGEFSDDEDRKICSLFSTIGSRWSIIAAQLPGRTDNDIKNYWNTKLKKKFMGNLLPTKSHKIPFGSPHDFSAQNPFLTSSSPYSSSYHYHFHTPYDSISPTFCGIIPPNSDRFLCPNFTQAYPNSSCSSSDGSSCVINAVQDYAFDGGETPLDHSIEEINQLITTNSSNLNFFLMDEVKTEDQLVLDSDC